MEEKSYKNEMYIGTVLGYISLIISYVYAILITPLVIRRLGQSEYGVYTLMGTFVNYFTLFDLGIGAAVIRYVAKYRQEKNESALRNFLSVTFIAYLFLCFCLMVVGGFAYRAIPGLFGDALSSVELQKCLQIFKISIISVVITMLGTVFTAALSGYEQFVVPRLINLIALILRIISNICILYSHPTAVAITSITVLFSVITTVSTSFYAIVRLKIRLRFRNLNYGVFREILTFSFFIFLQSIVSQLYWQIDNTLLGAMTSAAVVAVYGIGAQINSIVLTFTTSVTGVILPRITKMVVADTSNRELTHYMAKVSRIILAIYGFLSIGFTFLGKEFIEIWAGEGYSEAYYYAVIVIVASLVARVESPANDIMKAKNMHRFTVVTNLIGAALNIGVSILLIRKFGIIGAAIGTAIPMLVCNTFIYNLYLSRRVGLHIKEFFSETFSKIWIPFIISSAICVVLNCLKIEGIVPFFLRAGVYMATYWYTLYVTWLNEDEKAIAKKIIKRVRKNG